MKSEPTIPARASVRSDAKLDESMDIPVPESTRKARKEAAMRKRKKRHKIHQRRAAEVAPAPAKSEINVTPLVDVVLVLLIIFMVVTPMLHRGVDLELPTTKNHSKRQDTGEQLVVSVRSDGAYVEADKIEVEKLASVVEKELKNGGRPVNVRADKGLRFGDVRKVLEQVHAAGAPIVNMETQETKQ
jgi:biopolymer transport protein TolR